MTRFRPCIDLHSGRVKQIVGGTLRDSGPGPQENFVSDHPAEWFANLYRTDGLGGGHIILLGPGNEEAAKAALQAWPGGMQVGGGISPHNASQWIEAGASHVIATSWLFLNGNLDLGKVRELASCIGPHRLVIDLSCRRLDGGWRVATNRWQTVTTTEVTPALLDRLAPYCAEFLIHAADVEGLQKGMDEDLLRLLGASSPIPTTYAGGARTIADLERTAEITAGHIDLTIGSALDIFGGKGARYEDCVRFNNR